MWMVSDGTLNTFTSVIVVDHPDDLPGAVETVRARLRRNGGDPEGVLINAVGGAVDLDRVAR